MPKEEKKVYSYPYSRRRFLKGVAATGALAFIPWSAGCGHPTVSKGILAEHSQMAAEILEILFPDDGNGPDANRIQAYTYLNQLLADKNYDSDIQESIFKGFRQFADFSKEQKGKPFGKLSRKEKQALVHKANEFSWGENFNSRLLSVILDALLIDPIYGVNVHEIGWKWLGHIPGAPRPNPQNKYPEILHRKEELVIISGIDDL